MSRTDHSVLLGQSSEMSHCVKLVDKSWHWEDRGVDVRGDTKCGVGWEGMRVQR